MLFAFAAAGSEWIADFQSAAPDEAAYWPVCWERDVDPYGPAENASVLVSIAPRGFMLESFMVCLVTVRLVGHVAAWDGWFNIKRTSSSVSEFAVDSHPGKGPRALESSCRFQAINISAGFWGLDCRVYGAKAQPNESRGIQPRPRHQCHSHLRRACWAGRQKQ